MTNSYVGIDQLFLAQGASREAKAYAFLHAAFKKTEIGKNPVRDAMDCLIPFIATYTAKIYGNQVTAIGVQEYLKQEFGFNLPLYAIDQLMPNLQANGLVEYNKNIKAFIAQSKNYDYEIAKTEIDTDFEEIETSLKLHARRLGVEGDPPSGNWGQALVSFLRNRSENRERKFVLIKEALVDHNAVEVAIVASFIGRTHEINSDHFSKILKIFLGINNEDFLSTVAEIGTVKPDNPPVVFYDTALLLRQLGSSGKFLKSATQELTRYLQDLGFKIEFLSGNEAEVSNIIETILYKKDSGYELEGETAQAIADGEVSTGDLRALQNVFVERLASYGVFPAQLHEATAQENSKHQINETGLTEHIKRAALSSGRKYKHQNALNDSGYVGTVMRLRKGIRTRDLADCRFIFVTSNRFLASQSRRYLIQEQQLAGNSVPPVLSVGQVATIAWLLKDHSISPDLAGRELLANCYAAIRPDAEWFGFFREGLEKVIGDPAEYAASEKNSLILQATRRIAQEESFGNSAIAKQLNMAEIIHQAEKATEEKITRKEEEARQRLEALEKDKLEEVSNLTKDYEQKLKLLESEKKMRELEYEQGLIAERLMAEKLAAEKLKEKINLAAQRRASTILAAVKFILAGLLILASAYIAWRQIDSGDYALLFVLSTLVLFVLGVFTTFDFFGLKFWTSTKTSLEERLKVFFGFER